MLVIVLVVMVTGHCLVIHLKLICDYENALLCLKLPQHFSCEECKTTFNLSLFRILRYYNSLVSSQNGGKSATKNPMMHLDVQGLYVASFLLI